MTFAVLPIVQTVGAIATLASTVVSAVTNGLSGGAASGAAGSPSGADSNRMDSILKRQEDMQLKALEMQTEANIRKMMADTANSIATGNLDSGAKVQSASIKAAQGIHF